jgi:ketopantoate reductase
MIAQQPTAVGERDGRRTVRQRRIAKTFGHAGLPTKMRGHIEAWPKAHVFFFTAMCGASYLAGGDCRSCQEITPL